MKINKFTDEDSFITGCITKIKSISEYYLTAKGSFNIALTGGETAQKVYEKMIDLETDWSKWYFYFGDERCAHVESSELNSRMAEDSLLNLIPVNSDQIFKIPSHLGASLGAKEYSSIVNFEYPFDLVLLGLGDDGHIASLFPERIIDSINPAIPVFDSPKPPKDRISLSLNRINNSDNIMIMTKSKNKEKIIEDMLSRKEMPATQLSSLNEVNLFYF